MPTMLPNYHVGIVVADLRQAMSELSKIGFEWHAPVRNNSEVQTDDAPRTITPWMAYSKQGPPYLELLEQMPGTIWAETGLHHLGVWADDVVAESERLTAAGIPLLNAQHDNNTGAPTRYHQTFDGVRFELMDIGRTGPGLATYLSGAADNYLNGIADEYFGEVTAGR
ncbi:VOC family protein [Nocardia suismassiliense]|uniref:VOC family protein n=1 Tax=Nocardia suismassiliense TaxID=2077092 RepID=A0ABW6QZ23_9NOCA